MSFNHKFKIPSPSRQKTNLQLEMNELLKREEILWRDKVKSRWIAEGDANTRFFHLSTIIHRRYNSINSILLANNIWLTNRQDIGLAFQSYYTTLFTSCEPTFPDDFQTLIHPCISIEENNSLLSIPTEEEIQTAIFSMGSNTSPGPDGMTTNFYNLLEHCQGGCYFSSSESLQNGDNQGCTESYVPSTHSQIQHGF